MCSGIAEGFKKTEISFFLTLELKTAGMNNG